MAPTARVRHHRGVTARTTINASLFDTKTRSAIPALSVERRSLLDVQSSTAAATVMLSTALNALRSKPTTRRSSTINARRSTPDADADDRGDINGAQRSKLDAGATVKSVTGINDQRRRGRP